MVSRVFPARGVTTSPRGVMGGLLRAALLASTALAVTGLPAPARAADATWSTNPANGTYFSGSNWSSGGFPGPNSTGFFGASTITTLLLGSGTSTQPAGWTFNAGASDYTFNNYGSLAFTVAGIVVNGGSVTIANSSADGIYPAYLDFYDNSTAGSATIINNANTYTSFHNASTAGTAAITNNAGGNLSFGDTSTAGSATIVNNGILSFGGNSTAGNAAIANNAGGTVNFSNSTGPNGDNKLNAGSIAGAGNYNIGANQLTVGANNLATEVSGVISGAGGSLVKTGTGTLTLSGVNTYTGGTTVAGGTLAGTGTVGDVSVASGAALAGVQGQTLSTGSLTLAAGSAVNVMLGAPGNSTGLFHVGGDLTLAGTLNVAYAADFGQGLYRIIDYSGALTDNGMIVGTTPAGTTGVLQTATANQVNLLVSGTAGSLLFWNGATTTADGVIHGGSGTWSAGPATNWTDMNGAAASAWSGQVAMFQNGPGTVTVDASAGAVSAVGMQFVDAGWTVQGDAIVLDGPGGQATIRVGDGTSAGASASATIGSALTGSSALAKTDLGTLTLTGVNSYSGGTTISAGTLKLGDPGTKAAILGAVTVGADGIFDAVNADTSGVTGITNAGAVNFYNATSAGSAVIANNNALAFSDTSTAGSAHITNTGNLSFTGGSAAGSAVIANNSALAFSDTSTAGSARITNTGNLTFNDTGTAGTAVITNNAAGTLYFTGGSTAGNAAITNNAGGTVDFSGTTGPNGDGKISAGSIAGAGNFILGGNELTAGANNSTTTVSGVISGAGGSLVKAGTGTLTLSGVNTYSGGTTVAGGTLNISADSNLGSGALTILDGGTLRITARGTYTHAITLAGSATITASAVIQSGVISGVGGLVSASTMLTLTGANTYTGGTTVKVGTLQIGTADTAGSIRGAVSVGVGGTFNVVNADTSLITTIVNSDTTQFQNNTSAGSATIVNNNELFFQDASTAGSATITNNGPQVFFQNASTAGSATITNNAGKYISFSLNSTAENATIDNAGTLSFGGNSTAGNATITNGGTMNFTTNGTAGNATITNGGTMNFTANGTAGNATITNNAGGAVNFTGTGPAGDHKLSAGSIAGAGTYNLGANGLTVGANNLSTEVSGIVSGAGGSLIKTGTGTLTLSGADTYSGGTTVSAGTLQIGNGGTTGVIAGNVTDNAILAFNRADTMTFSGVISGSGAVQQAGAGTLILSGVNTYGGGTTVSAGTLSISSDSNLGNGGTLALLDGTALTFTQTGAYAHAITVAGNPVFNVASGQTVTQSGVISGAGGIVMTGTGTLILTAANSYGGGTTVSGGTLQLGDLNTAGAIAGAVSVSAGGTFDVVNADTGGITGITNSGNTQFLGNGTAGNAAIVNNAGGTVDFSAGTGPAGDGKISAGSIAGAGSFILGGNQLTVGANNSSTEVSSVISGAGGSLVKTGTGTLTLSGTNSYSGGTTISGGTLQLGNGGAGGSIVGDVIDNGILAFDRSDDVIFGAAIDGSGAVRQIGAGATILTADTTYSGGTTISGGTLQLGNGGTSGAILGNVVNNGMLAFNRSDNITFAGIISGSGSLTKQGENTLILTGANSYGGGTTISGGTLQIGNGGTTGAILGNVVNDGVLAFNRSDNVTFAGAISDSGAVRQTGTGITTLTGASTYTGGTTISAGGLQLGNLTTAGAISGAVSVGAGAALYVSNADTSGITGIANSGSLYFYNNSTAGTATITNSGYMIFNGDRTAGRDVASTAGSATIIDNSSLFFNDNSTAGTAAITVAAGGYLQFGATSTAASAAIAVASSGYLEFAGNSTGGNAAITNTAGGTVDFSAGTGPAGDSKISAGSIAGAGAYNLGTLELTVGANDASTTASGVISGAGGSLVKTGTGTLTLSGANIYTGGTTVLGGTLQLGSVSTTGSVRGAVTVGANGTFDVVNADTAPYPNGSFGIAAITNDGLTYFRNGTSASVAAITNNASLYFNDNSTAGAAAIVNTATGTVDFSASTGPAGDGKLSAGSIAGAGSYLLGGNALTVGSNNLSTEVSGVIAGAGGSLVKTGTGTLTLSGTNTYTGGTTVSAGTLSISADGNLGGGGLALLDGSTLAFTQGGTYAHAITVAGDPVFDVAAGQTVTQSGVIADGASAGDVVKTGAGVLILAADNTYSGGTVISGGTLQLGNGGTSGAILGDVADNGVLAFNRSDDVTFSGAISGSGSLTKLGANTLTLTGANSYSGGSTVSAGTLQLGDATDSGTILGAVSVGASGTLDIVKADTSGLTSILNAGRTNFRNDNSAGSAAITNNLLLSFYDNSTAGDATITSGGILYFRDASAAGSATIASNNVLEFYGTSSAGNAAITNNNILYFWDTSTAGNATIANDSALNFFNTSTAGSAAITNSGILQFRSTSTAGGATIANDSALYFYDTSTAGGAAITNSGTALTDFSGSTGPLGDGKLSAGSIAGGGSFVLGANELTVGGNGLSTTVSGVISGSGGSLVKTGSGTLTLTGDNSYSGGTTIGSGTLQVGDGGATGSLGSGDIDNNGILAFKRSDDITIANAISGSGTLTQVGNGTLTLTGANSYSGITTISRGTLQVGDGGTSGTLGGGAVTNNAALVFNRSDDITVANTISSTVSDAGSVSQIGGGILTLSGVNGYAGGTVIDTGTIRIANTGNLGNSGGAVTLRNGGTLGFTASMSLNPGRIITLADGGGAFDTGGNTVVITSIVTGVGSLTKSGAGTLVLAGTNAHSGGTIVEDGTLQIGNGNTGGSLGGGDVIDNGALIFSRSNALTVANNISGTGTLTQQGSGTLTLTGDNSYSGGTTIGSGTLQVGDGGATGSLGSGDVVDNGALTFALGGTLTVANNISGTGSLTQLGPGTTILTGADSYTGDTTVSGGRLQFGDGNAGGGGTLGGNVNVTGGTLAIQTPATLSVAQAVTLADNTTLSIVAGANGPALSAGSLTIGNGVTFDISGVGAQSGTVLIDTASGIHGDFAAVSVGGFSGTVDYLTVSTGKSADALQYIASYDLSWSAGNNLAHGTFTLTDASDSFAVGAVLADQAANSATGWNGTALTKAGAGTLILAADNTYSGGTTISGGTLQIGNGGTGGAILGDVADNGVLTFNRSDDIVFSGDISGAGAVTKQGGGTLTLSGTNTYTGGTTVSGGTLSISADGNLGGGTLALLDGTALAFTQSGAYAHAITVAGDPTFDVAAGQTVTQSGVVADGASAGEIVKTGAGVLILAADNSYSGGTTISGGVLQLGNGGTSGAILGDVVDNGVLAFNRSGTITFSGVISGSGAVRQTGTGTLILTGTNTYSGGTTISSGTLQIGNGGTGGSVAGNITDNGVLAFDRSDDVTFGGAIDGSGGIVKTGGSALTLSGVNGYSGATAVQGGTLLVNGSIAASSLTTVNSGATLGGSGTAGAAVIEDGGTLAGVQGQTLATGGLTLASGARVNVSLGAPGNGTGLFHVTGDLALGGTLNVADAGGFGHGLYRIIDYSGTLTDNGMTVGTIPVGLTGTVQTAVANQVNLLVSVDNTQFWNGTATAGDGAIHGGNGTWSAGPTNWTDVDGVAASAWGDKFAVFQNTPGTVTVDASAGAVSTIGMQFIGQGWTVQGDAIVLNGAGGATTIRVGDGTAASAADSATIGAPLTGGTSLVKEDFGTLILTGANSYSGGTTVSGGTLQIGDGGAAGSIAGDIVNNGTLAFDRSDAITFAGVISGNGALNQIGGGTTTLTGANGAAGAVTVGNGTLAFGQTGTFSAASYRTRSGAVTAIGAGAQLAVAGAFTQDTGATLNVALGGNGPIITADTASLGGTLNIAGLTAGAPAASALAGTRFQVIATANGISGDFANVTIGGASNPLDYLTVTGGRSADNRDYDAGLGLAWTAGAAQGNGTFTLANGADAFNVDVALADQAAAFAGGWDGKSLTKGGDGTLTLSAMNTYTGATAIAGGTLAIAATGGITSDVTNSAMFRNAGTVAGGVTNKAGATFTQTAGGVSNGVINAGTVNADGGALDGAIANTAGGVFNVGGTLTGDGTFDNAGGATLAVSAAGGYTPAGLLTNSGAVTVAAGGSLTAPAGIRNNAGGVITNNGTLTDALDNAGVLTNNGVYNADVASNTGTINNSAGGVWNGDFHTTGIVNNDGTINGALTQTAGTTTNNGTITGVVTVSGGLFAGTSSAGGLAIAGGAAIAPGAGGGIGTMRMAGNVTFDAGSIYQVAVNAAGQASRIDATGTIAINGGAVQVLAGAGNYAPSTTYTILSTTANGGRTGTFEGVSSNLAFLTPALDYDAGNVYLTLTRNSIDFTGVGATPNQVATGGGVESLGFGNPVYNAVLNLSAPQAQGAFDQLSGEIHASARTALIEDSRFVRGAVNDRMRAAFAAADDALAVWGQGFGAWGHINGDGNAARLDDSTGGFFIGADTPVSGTIFNAWRFGAVAGYSRTAFDVKDRRASGTSDNYHAGLYGGTAWGDLALRTGAAYTWHDIATERGVIFSGFTDSLKDTYSAATAQAFGELAYGFSADGVRFEPFADLAYVNLHTDGFAEAGGAAALTGDAANTGAAFTTLGQRAAASFDLAGITLAADGMLGWRHAFGDGTPLAAMRFAGGGDAFRIGGIPIARDAAAIEAGIDYALTPDTMLGVSYGGQFGSGMSDQSVRLNVNVKF